MKRTNLEITKLPFTDYKTKFDVDIHIWIRQIATYHGHDFFEFAICNKGGFLHYKNGKKAKWIKEGQVVFLTPNDIHSIETKEPQASHINISVSARLFKEICQVFDWRLEEKVFKNTTISLSASELKEINDCVDEIMQSNEKNELQMRTTLNHLAAEMFYLFLKREEQNKDVPEWLRSFVDLVCAPEYFAFRVQELYKYCNYSQPILAREFKKYYGMPFVSYFTREKMFYACGLLKNTNMGILEISNRLGFSGLSYFNSLFKKATGMSPSYYRKHQK